MKNKRNVAALLLVFIVSLLLQGSISTQVKKSYIVYLGGHPQAPEGVSPMVEEQRKDAHYELLGNVLGSKEKAQDAIFYSYTKHINGFAAVLEEEEAERIAMETGVVSVIPNEALKLHTTHSWEFLGLEKNGRIVDWSIWKQARYGEDTIIATLDTGVWPEARSFNDEGMGPIPSRWKGSCENGFPCNKKLIGARQFTKSSEVSDGKAPSHADSVRDIEGHGTHTLSTAAGRFVANASFYNRAYGTAKGGSPRARVAAYKVCVPRGCFSADILAGFEAAISDGVDVLSVSLGGDAVKYMDDPIAIGSFHAVMNGIVVVCSAGNSGPGLRTLSNVAPWIITVGASTLDRDYPTYLTLGNKKHIAGQSLSAEGVNAPKPIVLAEDVRASNATIQNAQRCVPGSLDPKKAKGKIVICIHVYESLPKLIKGAAVRDAGGAGMVIFEDISIVDYIRAEPHVLPAIHISTSDGDHLLSYLKSTKTPTASISTPKTELGIKAPNVAVFSSRGPNKINPEILKPDVIAPGVQVLAAYPPNLSPSYERYDHRRVNFQLMSGTSMSCPHVSGLAGLLKTRYPHWSPAAIRSAITTTANLRDNKGSIISDYANQTATPLDYGSGHVHPNSAMYPGLVYDLAPTDYLNFLCSQGYNSSTIATFYGKPYTCPSMVPTVYDLNYPTITVPVLNDTLVVERTVKNVGPPATYHARVQSPRGLLISVKPKVLDFKKVGETKTFKVKLTADKDNKILSMYLYGALTWGDGKHAVRSQVVVKVGGLFD